MVDEKKEQSAGNPDEVSEEEKKSNKTFTQSEFDTKMYELEKKFKSQLSEYSGAKEELEKLKKEKQERELSEMSEVEKSKKLIEEMRKEKERLEIENKNLAVRSLRNEVLSNKDFSILPMAYRSQVTGDTVDDILASAKAQVEQYNKDFKEAKKSTAIPSSLGAGEQFNNNTPKTISEQVTESMRLKAQGKRF